MRANRRTVRTAAVVAAAVAALALPVGAACADSAPAYGAGNAVYVALKPDATATSTSWDEDAGRAVTDPGAAAPSASVPMIAAGGGLAAAGAAGLGFAMLRRGREDG